MQPGDRLAHYEILAILGAGGMGEVYLARDLRLGREVALKTLRPDRRPDPGLLARFRAEARTLAALNHRNVVTIHAVEEADGTPFITMEHVRGRSLKEAVPAGGFDPDRWLELFRTVAGAVAAAHRAGIVHRDLKPANVMLSDDGEVRVLDFGLAKIRPTAPDDPADDTLTASLPGALTGTLPYMSPEQVRGDEVSPASDVFALGVLFHELATGIRVFQGRTPADLTAAILGSVPAPLSELRADFGPGTVRIIARCLHKEPSRRYADADALHRDLLELVPGEKADGSTPGERSEGAASIRFAVLDFENLAKDPAADWLATGIAETVTTDVERLPGLSVASRDLVVAAARAGGAGDQDSRLRMGRRLRVRYLIHGAYQQLGERIRITGHVLDVASGQVAGSAKIDGTMARIFELQDEVLSRLLGSIQLDLAESDIARIARPETVTLLAYENYAKGRGMLLHMGAPAFREAERHLRDALKIDPDYALAHVAFAQMRAMGFIASTDVRDLHEAMDHLNRALAIDPELGEPHMWMAYCLARLGRYEEAIAAGERAVAHDRDRPQAHYFAGATYWVRGGAAYVEGDWEATVRFVKRAVQLQPTYQPGWMVLADALVRLGRRAEARQALQQAVALETTGAGEGARFIGADTQLASLDLAEGHTEAAARHLADSRVRLEASTHVYAPQFLALTLLGEARLAAGRQADDEAVELLQQALRLGDRHPRSLGMGRVVARIGFALAAALARAGRRDEAEAACRDAHELFTTRTRLDFCSLWSGADADILVEQAGALVALGRDGEAAGVMERAVGCGYLGQPAGGGG